MSDAQLRNLLVYIGIAALNMCGIAAASGLAAGTLPGFRPGEAFEPAGPALSALLAVLLPSLSLWLHSNRPRIGSEKLAREVETLRKDGVSRDDMTVLRTDDLKVLTDEAARLRRIRPLRQMAEADEALEKAGGSRG